MHLTYRNVNDAFEDLVKLFSGQAHKRDASLARVSSRNGDVIMVQEPTIVTYTHPRERVLFNAARDANPFFHLYEALWMLAGRNDVKSLAYYNSGMKNYSDDGETFNGAYGYRWRQRNTTKDWEFPDEPIDQLPILIDHLKENPNSRRAVLQMWNVEDDLLKIDESKDVCCNTNAYFSIRKLKMTRHPTDPPEKPGFVTDVSYLDMTVCNRSNDLIWGMLGANVVHFSFLQEYMAAMIGVEVGVYNQFTNNLHVYLDKFEPDKWLNEYNRTMHSGPKFDYGKLNLVPLIKANDKSRFDYDCKRFVEDPIGNPGYDNTFFATVAQPVCLAFEYHKQRRYDRALCWCSEIESEDWRIACIAWIQKRKTIWERNNEATSADKA